MDKRRYEDRGIVEAMAEIFTDIARHSYSQGWSTKCPDLLSIIKCQLAKFNIQYVSDFEGRWELVEPEKEEK